MPAKSRKQFRLMSGIAEGSIKSKGKLTPAVAKEFVSGQSQAGLPELYRQAKPHRRRDWRFT